MSRTQHTKFAVLGGLLLLCAITLSITEDNQRLAFAQITPAPEKAGGSDDSPDAGSADGNDSDDDGDVQDLASNDEVADSSGSDEQITSEEQDDEATIVDEQENDESSSMVEAIVNEVNEALSAAGILGP